MDVLEVGTDSEKRRILSHNDPDYYPMKVRDHTKQKNAQFYEL